MYCEQMMREQGFDDGPELPPEHAHGRDLAGVPDHPRRPDAPRRDRRRRGGPTSWSSRPASSGRTPRAEVNRYTYTPTYQLSYLLGKVLLLAAARRRAAPPRRPASRFGDFHDALLGSGTLPISFHRRPSWRRRGRRTGADAATGRAAARPLIVSLRAGHPGDRPRGRPLAPRVLAGRRDGRRAPDGSARADRGAVRRAGRAADPPRRLRRRAGRRARRTSRRSARSRRGSPCRSSSPAASTGRADPARLRGRRDARRRSRWPSPTSPSAPARLPRGRRRLAGGRPRPAAGPARRVPVAAAAAPRHARRPRRRARGHGRRAGSSLSHGGDATGPARSSPLVRRASTPRSSSPAASPTSPAIRRAARRRRRRASSSARRCCPGAIDYPAALEAAA